MELNQRCWNHEAREAACRCPACGRSYCRECVSEHEGRLLCAACLSMVTADREPETRGFRKLAPPAMIAAGVLLAWLIYWAAGAGLIGLIHRMEQEPRSYSRIVLQSFVSSRAATILCHGKLDAEAMWGRQSCLQPPFLGGFSSHKRVSAQGTRRLKAGGSQNWLPHKAPFFQVLVHLVIESKRSASIGFRLRSQRHVGQVGNLRPIVNRPVGGAYRSQGSPAPFAACRYVGQVGNLRPIVNRPAGGAYRSQGSPAPFAACRYVGQVGNLRPIVNRPAGGAYRSQGSPAPFAACRYVGQVGNLKRFRLKANPDA